MSMYMSSEEEDDVVVVALVLVYSEPLMKKTKN